MEEGGACVKWEREGEGGNQPGHDESRHTLAPSYKCEWPPTDHGIGSGPGLWGRARARGAALEEAGDGLVGASAVVVREVACLEGLLAPREGARHGPPAGWGRADVWGRGNRGGGCL